MSKHNETYNVAFIKELLKLLQKMIIAFSETLSLDDHFKDSDGFKYEIVTLAAKALKKGESVFGKMQTKRRLVTKKKPLARESEYIKRGGTQCLICTSPKMEISKSHSDDGNLLFDIHCCACGATWKDVYKLVAAEGIKKGKKPSKK